MSQFDVIVKNIASESEKCHYNPEKHTNWDILPMEMRAECIKRMDFKTRTCLGGTSHAEKSLVASKTYKFEHLRIKFNFKKNGNIIAEWNIKAISQELGLEVNVKTKKTPDSGCISSIFKFAEVKNFCLDANEYQKVIVLPVLEQLVKFAPFGFKRVSVFNNRFIDFFIKNCRNLEKVDVSGRSVGFAYRKMLALPSLINVKKFQFSHFYALGFNEFLCSLVQKWIDNNAEVGKSVQFYIEVDWTIGMFAVQFRDRVIEKTEEIVRIRMNNDTTQVLLRIIGNRRSVEYFSCKVIPIDMPESEYGIGDEWIQAVYEKSLKKDGILEKAAEFDAEDQEVWRQHYP